MFTINLCSKKNESKLRNTGGHLYICGHTSAQVTIVHARPA